MAARPRSPSPKTPFTRFPQVCLRELIPAGIVEYRILVRAERAHPLCHGDFTEQVGVLAKEIEAMPSRLGGGDAPTASVCAGPWWGGSSPPRSLCRTTTWGAGSSGPPPDGPESVSVGHVPGHPPPGG